MAVLTPGEQLKAAIMLAYLRAEFLKLRSRERELVLKLRDLEESTR